jgi:cytochrome bd-type quinol oxidase subunit 2
MVIRMASNLKSAAAKNSRQKQVSRTANKMLGAFCLCLLALAGLFITFRLSNRASSRFIVHNLMWVFSAAGLAGFAAVTAIRIMRKKKSRETGMYAYYPEF